MDISGNVQEPAGMIALNTMTGSPAAVAYQANDATAKALLTNLAILIPMVKTVEAQLDAKYKQDFADPIAAAQTQNQVKESADLIAKYRETIYRQALEGYVTTVENWDKNLGLPSQFQLPPMPKP